MNGAEPAWTTETLRAPHRVVDKSARVRSMFNSIASRYELVNRVCSFGRDASWRRTAVALARVSAQDDVLDLACGTGDLARAFFAARPRTVVGLDFAHEMLVRAVDRSPRNIGWCEGNALRLPFANESFSIASCAFGIRNFQELQPALEEVCRVLQSGGRIVILEFSEPKRSVARRVYRFYSHRIMPAVATRISGDTTGAYRYLPKSVATFHSVDEICATMTQAGFRDVETKAMTMGVVTLFLGVRA